MSLDTRRTILKLICIIIISISIWYLHKYKDETNKLVYSIIICVITLISLFCIFSIVQSNNMPKVHGVVDNIDGHMISGGNDFIYAQHVLIDYNPRGKSYEVSTPVLTTIASDPVGRKIILDYDPKTPGQASFHTDFVLSMSFIALLGIVTMIRCVSIWGDNYYLSTVNIHVGKYDYL